MKHYLVLVIIFSVLLFDFITKPNATILHKRKQYLYENEYFYMNYTKKWRHKEDLKTNAGIKVELERKGILGSGSIFFVVLKSNQNLNQFHEKSIVNMEEKFYDSKIELQLLETSNAKFGRYNAIKTKAILQYPQWMEDIIESDMLLDFYSFNSCEININVMIMQFEEDVKKNESEIDVMISSFKCKGKQI